MNDQLNCLHIVVEGRVQGVGFRNFVQENAQILGLTGWVRNVKEDQVEVWAEGDQAALNRLLNLVRQGPRSAYVTGYRIEPETPKGSFVRFQIAPTSWF
jgi:acylphosphatase